MIGFCPLASGSKGNSVYLGTADTKILIDAGLSGKMTKTRLAEIGVELSDIDAILVTHEHSDHIKGLKVLAYKMGIPVLANSDTANEIINIFKETPPLKIFSTGEAFQFGDLEIHPFSIQHDTADPVGFVINYGEAKIGYCADIGFASTLVQNKLRLCTHLYIESNHKPSMVHACPRPYVYKQRVLSRSGHLSNEDCGQLIQKVMHPGLQSIYLAHLSSECNHPEVALSTIREIIGNDVTIEIAHQDKVSKPILFTKTLAAAN
ncbi:MAG: MBL fold metallo-hydrolase [Chlamydiota bacterium]